MDEHGVRRLTCDKDHSHWGEVSVQNDPWERGMKSGRRCAQYITQVDPQQGYGSRGLKTVPTEIRTRFNGLNKDDRWKHTCRR